MTKHIEGRIRSRAKRQMFHSKMIANIVADKIQSLTPRQVEIVFNMCLAEVASMLLEGKRVSLLRFGQFRIEKLKCGAYLKSVGYTEPIPVIKFRANRKFQQKLRATNPDVQPKRVREYGFRRQGGGDGNEER